MLTLVIPGCPFSLPAPGVWMDDACHRANLVRLAEIERARPDAVVVMGSYRAEGGRTESTPSGNGNLSTPSAGEHGPLGPQLT
ncbi:MAG: hypothetical protein ACRDQB_15575 [Thermocrispum sp.]